MARTELQRRRLQRETLAKMLETAEQDGDDVRAARVTAGIHETNLLITTLEEEAATPPDERPKRRRR